MQYDDFQNSLFRYRDVHGAAATNSADDIPGIPPRMDFSRSVEKINADLSVNLPRDNWWNQLSPEQKDIGLEKLLSVLNPDVTREYWLPIVAACARSGAPNALEICREWSKRSGRYSARNFDAEFKSFETQYHGSGYGIGTIISAVRHVAPTLIDAISPAVQSYHLKASDSLAAARGTKLKVLLAQPPYKRRTEHGGDFIFGTSTLLSAGGGLGKTSLMMSTAVALASGVPILGKEVIKPRCVTAINFEEPDEELAHKLRAILNHHTKLPPDTADRITLYGAGTLAGLTFTCTDNRGTARLNEPAFKLLEQVLVETKAEILLMDSMSQLFPVGGNDTGQVYPAMTRLNSILSKLGCAAMIAAHTRKGGVQQDEGAEALLGSVGFTNAARRVIGIRHPLPDTCRAIGVPYGRESDIREIVDLKANYTRLEDSHFIEIIGVPMGNAAPPDYPREDWVGVVTLFRPQPGGRSVPSAAMQAALATIAAGTAGGTEPYSPAPQAGARGCLSDIANAIAPHLGGNDPSRLKHAAKDALKEAMSKGWAESFDVKIGRNTRKGLRVVWSATPWAGTPAPGGNYVV